MRSIRKIISGGQTGTDLAAWDVARELAIPFGGFVPAGRTNENGPIPSEYDSIKETASPETVERTRRNVETSDGTLIICRNKPTGGTLATLEHCKNVGKPVFVADVVGGVTDELICSIGRWLDTNNPNNLNVAGPRQSEDPEIYALTHKVLYRILKDRVMSRKDLNELLLYIHADIKSDFRHWDQIRWLIPSWYVALLAGAAAIFAQERFQNVHWTVLSVIGTFGLLCNFLALRTVQYHSKQMKRFQDLCEEIDADELLERELRAKLPFSLDFPGVLFTATFWFHFFVFVTAVFSLGIAFIEFAATPSA